MADKRMFTKKIIDSDAFLDMPLSTQALYFHLNMRADDDGFINNPKKVARVVGASDDDLKLLVLKRFVIGFESGVIVIKHWWMHNTLKSDRYHPTDYQEELSRLGIKPNKSYTDHPEALLPPAETGGDKLEPEWKQDGTSDIGLGLGIGLGLEEKKESSRKKKAPAFVPPTLDQVQAYCRERSSSVDPVKFFEYYEAGGWRDSKGNQVRNWKQKLITWERKDDGRSQHPRNTPQGAKGNAIHYD